MIKVTISQLLDSTETLKKLSSMQLKARLAFQIGRVLKAADEEMTNFSEARMNLIKKYGEKDENGQLITDEKDNCKIPNDSTEAFSAELNELIDTEVEINANPIHLADLEDLDFTPSEMVLLEPFIDFGE